MPDKIVSDERWEQVTSMANRQDRMDAARVALRRAYPEAPQPMLDAAGFHVFVDGVPAALDWIAAAEQFLQDPDKGMDYGATAHLLYHLLCWQQLESVLPLGKASVLDRLDDISQFIAEDDPEAATSVVDELRKMFLGEGDASRAFGN